MKNLAEINLNGNLKEGKREISSQNVNLLTKYLIAACVIFSSLLIRVNPVAAAWKDKPSFGIVATEDQAINPDIERNMYKRAHTKITEIKGSSHAVFISNPEAVAQVIIDAAQKR
jgi:pimeloyl-ACP methyl ester carboxylesterase